MTSQPRVLAVCRVHRLLPDPGQVGITAIDKRPVDGPVKVRALGLYADVQADRKYHGGEEQAVYAYADEVAQQWAAELDRKIPPGLFGENLRTADLAVDDALLGERWRIGGVELEVSSPRVPCATFGRRMGEKQWVRRFTERALTGAYLRVLGAGALQAGDEVEVISRPAHDVSVQKWFRDRDPRDARTLREAAEAGEFTMGPSMAEMVDASLARA